MLPILETLLAMAAAVFVHVSAMAGAGRAFGIAIRKVVYGAGWALYQRGVATFKLVPFGGYVRFKDSYDGPIPEAERFDAYDHQPLWIQVAILLSGASALLLASVLLLGAGGLHSFISGFGQIVAGALNPLTLAQSLIRTLRLFIDSRGLLALIGLVCAKWAAVNLLPIPLLNGGQILMTLARVNTRAPQVATLLQQAGLCVLVGIYGSWAVALCVFVWRNV